MEEKIRIVIEISRKAADRAIDVVESHTDEGSSTRPYPASAEWCEFQSALREGYDLAIKSKA